MGMVHLGGAEFMVLRRRSARACLRAWITRLGRRGAKISTPWKSAAHC
jgi:hypothetical protein